MYQNRMLERTEREEKRSDRCYTRKDQGSEESICFLEVQCGLLLCIVAFVLLIAIAVVFVDLACFSAIAERKEGRSSSSSSSAAAAAAASSSSSA